MTTVELVSSSVDLRENILEELAEVFRDAGLLTVTARDLSEAIITHPNLVQRLRMLTGDIILITRDTGLQGEHS